MWYFGCRHTYEDTLVAEMCQTVPQLEPKDCANVAPGLVCVRSGALSSFSSSSSFSSVAAEDELLGATDFTYALQVVPDVSAVKGASINDLAKGAVSALERDHATKLEALLLAPRGALALHALVPDMFKASANPDLKSRCEGVSSAVRSLLRERFRAARPRVRQQQQPSGKQPCTDVADANSSTDGTSPEESSSDQWVLQLLLTTKNELAVSLSKSKGVTGALADGETEGFKPIHLGTWPDLRPAGLSTDTTVDAYMPSSAYRKLAEALALMGWDLPSSLDAPSNDPSPPDHCRGSDQAHAGIKTCVDLGASPGGWTALLRRFGWRVTAVDRSVLDPALWVGGEPANLKDFVRRHSVNGFPPAPPPPQTAPATLGATKAGGGGGGGIEAPLVDNHDDPAAAPLLTFVRGDAFAWEPPQGVDLMVSDVASYPERVAELLERWCGGGEGGQGLAREIVVTCKFQGGEGPDWAALEAAKVVATKHGYSVRSKHFFSNKNECTLMARKNRLHIS